MITTDTSSFQFLKSVLQWPVPSFSLLSWWWISPWSVFPFSFLVRGNSPPSASMPSLPLLSSSSSSSALVSHWYNAFLPLSQQQDFLLCKTSKLTADFLFFSIYLSVDPKQMHFFVTSPMNLWQFLWKFEWFLLLKLHKDLKFSLY